MTKVDENNFPSNYIDLSSLENFPNLFEVDIEKPHPKPLMWKKIRIRVNTIKTGLTQFVKTLMPGNKILSTLVEEVSVNNRNVTRIADILEKTSTSAEQVGTSVRGIEIGVNGFSEKSLETIKAGFGEVLNAIKDGVSDIKGTIGNGLEDTTNKLIEGTQPALTAAGQLLTIAIGTSLSIRVAVLGKKLFDPRICKEIKFVYSLVLMLSFFANYQLFFTIPTSFLCDASFVGLMTLCAEISNILLHSVILLDPTLEPCARKLLDLTTKTPGHLRGTVIKSSVEGRELLQHPMIIAGKIARGVIKVEILPPCAPDGYLK